MKLIVIALVIFGIVFWVNTLVKNSSTSNNNNLECVPAKCCHSTACVPKGQEEDCAAIQCSNECVPGTLDCNQARCEPIKGKCEVVLNN